MLFFCSMISCLSDVQLRIYCLSVIHHFYLVEHRLLNLYVLDFYISREVLIDEPIAIQFAHWHYGIRLRPISRARCRRLRQCVEQIFSS